MKMYLAARSNYKTKLKKSNSSFKIASAQHVGGSKTRMLGQKELKLTGAALSQAEVVVGLKSSRN